jgi:hypothetical protein
VTWNRDPAIEVDDIVATPYGEQKVVQVDIVVDRIFTQDPVTGLIVPWDQREVEEPAPPDIGDVEDVERWLRVKAVIVPSVIVETDTIRCNATDCSCGHCYRIVKRLAARGMLPRTEIIHHKDAEVCTCDFEGGAHSACACMETVNIRWAT